MDAQAANRMIAFFSSVARGEIEQVRHWIAEGMDAASVICHGTPLHQASTHTRQGQAEMVRVLLDAGGEASAEDNRGRTPLHSAGSMSVEVARMLIAAGADAAAKDYSGRTPLHDAATGEMARFLLDAGGHPSGIPDAGTPMHQAVMHDRAEVARVLIAAGADVGHGLHIAAQYGSAEVAKVLIGAGADPSGLCSVGLTPLHQATWQSKHCVTEVTRVLLLGGADVTATFWGATPLLDAATQGHAGMARLLLDAGGSDAEAKDSDGWTALHNAAFHGHNDTVRVFLDAGANVAAVCGGATALHNAAAQGRVAIARTLLRAGADVDAPDAKGETPLHWSARNGRVEMGAMLLGAEAGLGVRVRGDVVEAGLGVRNSAGTTPEGVAFAALESHVGIYKGPLDRYTDLRDRFKTVHPKPWNLNMKP